MSDTDETSYPGGTATPDEILALADEYRAGAKALLEKGRKGQPLSLAPARLCAIHAIELYLNADLLARGTTPGEIRSHAHDLASRINEAGRDGLVLRKRTALHLARMTENREYLVSRYGPELTATCSQINRLMATLEEVARKTANRLSRRHSSD